MNPVHKLNSDKSSLLTAPSLIELHEYILAHQFEAKENHILETDILTRIMRYLWQQSSDSSHLRLVVCWLTKYVFCSLESLKVSADVIMKPVKRAVSIQRTERGQSHRLHKMFMEKPSLGPIEDAIDDKLRNLEFKLQARQRRVFKTTVEPNRAELSDKSEDVFECLVSQPKGQFESADFFRDLFASNALFRTKFVPYRHLCSGFENLFANCQEKSKELKHKIRDLRGNVAQLKSRLEECLRKEEAEQQTQLIQELVRKCDKLRLERYDLVKVSLTNAFELISQKTSLERRDLKTKRQEKDDFETKNAQSESIKESFQKRMTVLKERVNCLSELYVELEDIVHFNVLRMKGLAQENYLKKKSDYQGELETSIQRLFGEMETLREKFNLVC